MPLPAPDGDACGPKKSSLSRGGKKNRKPRFAHFPGAAAGPVAMPSQHEPVRRPKPCSLPAGPSSVPASTRGTATLCRAAALLGCPQLLHAQRGETQTLRAPVQRRVASKMSPFPGAPRIKRHTPGGLRRQKQILSRRRRPGVRVTVSPAPESYDSTVQAAPGATRPADGLVTAPSLCVHAHVTTQPRDVTCDHPDQLQRPYFQ